jgi:hypothetical protein
MRVLSYFGDTGGIQKLDTAKALVCRLSSARLLWALAVVLGFLLTDDQAFGQLNTLMTASTPKVLWQRGEYRAAWELAGKTPGPEANLYNARWQYAQAKLQTAERQAIAVVAQFARTDWNRVEAYDIAARAAYMRGDYPAAARYARSQCLLLPLPVSRDLERPETIDGLDPFCRRVPATFLSRYKTPRIAEEIGAHNAAMQPARPTVTAVVGSVALEVLFDSGAENSFIQERDITRLGVIRSGQRTEIQGFTNTRVPAEWGILPVLELLGWRLRDVPVLILPNVFPNGAIPPLVLGLNELWPFELQFDFINNQMMMNRSAGAVNGDRSTLIIGPALKIPVTVPLNNTERVVVYGTIDTGSSSLILSREALEIQQVIIPSSNERSSVLGVSGSLSIERLTLTAVEL